MNILKPLGGLFLLFIGIQAQSQADLNDFLSGQVVGNEVGIKSGFSNRVRVAFYSV